MQADEKGGPPSKPIMAPTIKLSQLAIGSRAIVRELPPQGSASLRLREMGVLPGVNITLVRAAPFGDPLEIQVRGYNLTLRKSEAEHVMVEMLKS
jgi:Fe2+ transport system protein FeoA